MVTNALRRGSSRRARSAAVKLILRRAVASSVGQSGMRAQVDIAFEFTGKPMRLRAAGRAGARGRGTYPFFDGSPNCAADYPTSEQLLFGSSIWVGGLNGTPTPIRGGCTCRQSRMHR